MENTILNEQQNFFFNAISGLKSNSIYEQRKQSAIDTLNSFLIHYAFRPLDQTEIFSLDITGNETEEELQSIAFSFQSVEQTEED